MSPDRRGEYAATCRPPAAWVAAATAVVTNSAVAKQHWQQQVTMSPDWRTSLQEAAHTLGCLRAKILVRA